MLTSIEEEQQLIEGLPGQPRRKELNSRYASGQKSKDSSSNPLIAVLCVFSCVVLILFIWVLDDESRRGYGIDLNDIGSRFHDLAVSNDTVAPRPTFRGQSPDIFDDFEENLQN